MNLYEVCCHGCGKVFTIQATHLSCSIDITAPNGNSYNARACQDCMEDGDKVHRAYKALCAGTFKEFKQENWK